MLQLNLVGGLQISQLLLDFVHLVWLEEDD